MERLYFQAIVRVLQFSENLCKISEKEGALCSSVNDALKEACLLILGKNVNGVQEKLIGARIVIHFPTEDSG